MRNVRKCGGPMHWIPAAVLFVAAGSIPSCAAETEAHDPATVADAAKILDLSTLPLMEKAEKPNQQKLAGLSYNVAATVEGAFGFHRKQLINLNWKELPGGYSSEQSASGTFTRDGYTLSIMVFPTGKEGAVSVTLNQHGNVDLAKLPVPEGVKSFYDGPVSKGYLTETPVDTTAQVCQKLLMDQGWQPYGSAGDVFYFKQNAIRLSARVASAPAQGGKTVIDYSTMLMSADLPAPKDTVRLQYSDSPTQISLDVKSPPEDVLKFYRETLNLAGWKATTDHPINIDFKKELIFRNPQKEMLTLESHEVDGITRILLRHETAAEVAETDRRAKIAVAEAEKKRMEQKKPGLKIAVTLPADAKDIEKTKSRIEFKVSSGKARGIVEAWRKQFVKEGWKEDVATLDDMAGAVALSKGTQHLTIDYTDTGFLPSEIDIHATGAELEQTTTGKKGK